jgi:hypothetical protein
MVSPIRNLRVRRDSDSLAKDSFHVQFWKGVPEGDFTERYRIKQLQNNMPMKIAAGSLDMSPVTFFRSSIVAASVSRSHGPNRVCTIVGSICNTVKVTTNQQTVFSSL